MIQLDTTQERDRHERPLRRWHRGRWRARPLAVQGWGDRAWQVTAKLLARLLSRYMTRGFTGVSAYARGSLADCDARFRYSDIDLILIAPDHRRRPGENRLLLLRRWRSLKRGAPLLSRGVDLAAWEEAELKHAITWQRSPGSGRRQSLLDMPICVRPGLYGTGSQWALLCGTDRRQALPAHEHDKLWWNGWAELQFWCRQAFRAVLDPSSRSVPYGAFKLAVEPLRIWLWVAHGVRTGSRLDVLDQAAARIPEAQEAVEWVSTLPRSPGRSERERLLAAALEHFFNLSNQLAGLWADEARRADQTQVHLRGKADGTAVPLCDWVARTCPIELEEHCLSCDGDPADPHALQRAAEASDPTTYAVLRTGRLLVLPVSDERRSRLRALQCSVTDPVTFALLAGEGTAEFPGLAGWSARDCAMRAVQDHAARLVLERRPLRRAGAGVVQRTGWRLITAARAALFLESVEAGAPELAITAEALLHQLARRDGTAAELVEEAVAGLRSSRAAAMPCYEHLRRFVADMEPFARVTAGEPR